MRAAALLSARPDARRSRARVSIISFAILSILGLAAVPATAAPGSLGAPEGSGVGPLWNRVPIGIASDFEGRGVPLALERFRGFTLDRTAMKDLLATAPMEFTRAAERRPLVLSLPAPDGRFHRFEVQESPVMEPKLAARHPDIKSYSGRGLTDPTATIRFDLSPLGFHASVRGQRHWYIDPYFHLDQGLYASYYRSDLQNTHGDLVEAILRRVRQERSSGASERSAHESSMMLTSVGGQLKTFRLALANDPPYATYHAGLTTAAKNLLVNRVTQIYEDETAIRLVLVGDNDDLNFDTTALATVGNGPCGTAACFTAAQLMSCDDNLLGRYRIVAGQLVGADNYDIGHMVLAGVGGGYGPGRVGSDYKAGGCTGHGNPKGDAFAVDYVAHEIGHQFSGRHSWNGANCDAGQWTAGSNVEPGSGSSIMGYAGICGADDLQPNSDPYFSQKSFDQITTFVTSSQPNLTEVQNASLVNFDNNGDSFTLTLNGMTSGAITRGTNYNAAGIQAALAAIGAAGATVQGFGGAITPDDTGFQVTFAGTANVAQLALTNQNNMSGFVGTTAQGGAAGNQGSTTSVSNSAPSVSAPGPFTIPRRTPFALTGSGGDADGDTVTYLWEQNDAGAASIALNNPAKVDGALFRQFGTALDGSAYIGTDYNALGENHPTTSPTRVFPDMAQILANNTNADSGDCPAAPANQVDCYSEFLPTGAYTGALHFRLTARDNRPGGGGVNTADTTVNLGPATAGPFLVTSPNSAATYTANTPQTVTWDVAQTDVAPISTANVDILFSSDGGSSFTTVLASSTPNDGSQSVTMPDVDTTQGRIMIRAVGNVFFDVSNANFTLVRRADMELVSKVESADPVFAGETVTYTITARNNGPSPTANARVVDALPSDLSVGSSSISCIESPTDTLTCGLGALGVGAEKTFTVTASIPRDLVHNAGAPVTVSNTATASSELPDPDSTNDEKTESTLVKAKADLQAVSIAALNPPIEMIIGEPATVTLRQVITNEGPSAPMDVRVTRSAGSTSNGTVDPVATSHQEAAIGYQEHRTIEQAFEIECTGPGDATFTFGTAVAPDRPDDIEVDPTNNSRQTSFTLDCIVPIAINNHPGSFENPVNIDSKKGEVPIAALTTVAGEYGLPLAFDATTIDATTVRFGPEAVVASGAGARDTDRRGRIQDALERSDETTMDGDLDNVLHFRIRESQLTGTETEACIRGKFLGAGGTLYTFHGCDFISFP